MTLTLRPEPLTAAGFAPFGEVLDTEGRDSIAINQGTARRFHRLAEIDTDPEGTAVLSIFRADARKLPLDVMLMERHPLGSQAFMPLQDDPYLVVVAGDPAEPRSFRAFRARRQGVNFRRGAWHHPLVALSHGASFLIADRDGPGDNLEEYPLREGMIVVSDD